MATEYLPWPAPKEELVRISVYNDSMPVETHRHDFIEIVFILQGSCLHRYQNTEAVLIPGDAFIVVPHEEHAYDIKSKIVIYNCLFYPEALGEDWKQIKEMAGIFELLMVEPLFRDEAGYQEILHINASIMEEIIRTLDRMREEQDKKTARL